MNINNANAAEYAMNQIGGLTDEAEEAFDKKIPHDSQSLIEGLEDIFPERSPYPMESDRDYWHYVGKREIINYLKLWQENSRKTNNKEDD